MRIFIQFADAIRRSWQRAHKDYDPQSAAEMLDTAIGEATDIDGATLLSLAPESMASIMQVSGVDSRVSEYIARSLLLSSSYLEEAGNAELAQVRKAQAQAVAKAYGVILPDNPEDVVKDLDGGSQIDQA